MSKRTVSDEVGSVGWSTIVAAPLPSMNLSSSVSINAGLDEYGFPYVLLRGHAFNHTLKPIQARGLAALLNAAADEAERRAAHE
jgi:hypothetical protein